jgi:anti-anti-sigma regulatory factor
MQVAPAQMKLTAPSRHFSHAEACRMVSQALEQAARRVVIDFTRVEEATTSAFAQLILLRRSLLRSGRDLCLTGLRDRTAGLFEVNRLAAVLPLA